MNNHKKLFDEHIKEATRQYEEDIENYEWLLEQKKEIIKILKDRIDKAVEILGEYKHYSTPDEIQNMLNEEIVDKAFILLKGDKE